MRENFLELKLNETQNPNLWFQNPNLWFQKTNLCFQQDQATFHTVKKSMKILCDQELLFVSNCSQTQLKTATFEVLNKC